MDRRAPPELTKYLTPFPEGVAGVVYGLRARVLAVMPNAHEFVWDATNAVSLVYTPSIRWQDGVCHIAVYSKHVNLGFNDGATLDDPLNVLQGTGSRIRHVTFRSVEALQATWLDDYLHAALANADLSFGMGDGGTTVRASTGAKRRPGATA